jgi:O-antigen/teichoic acid export membrane protein
MALSAFFILYITRKLGSSDFGKYAVAFSLASILVIIAELGTNTILTREVSRKRADAPVIFGNVILLRGFLTFFYFLSLLATVFLLAYPEDIILICILMGGVVLGTSFLDLLNSVFRGWEKMQYEAVVMVLNRILVVASGVFVLYYGGDLLSFIIAILLANSILLYPVMQICFRKFLRPQIKINIILIRSILREAFPVGMMFMLLMVMTKSGVVLLSYFKDYSAVGWYGAPLRLMESMMVFPLIFSIALLPSLTNLFDSYAEGLSKFYEKTVKGLVIVGLPMAVWISFFSKPVVELLFGHAFEPSSVVLPFLVSGFFFYSLNMFMGHFLIAIHRQAVNLSNYLLAAVVTIGASVLLIPRFSYIGVGCSFLLGQIVLFLLGIYLIGRFHFRIPRMVFLKPALGVCLMVLALSLMGERRIWSATIIGLGSYLLFLLFSRALQKEDLALVRNFLLPHG